MTLLEEAIRVLAPPMDLFVNALTLDSASTQAIRLIIRCIDNPVLSAVDVVGEWAAILFRTI